MSRTMSLLCVYITKLFSIFVQQCLSCEFVKPQLQIDENPTATIFAMAETGRSAHGTVSCRQ